MAWWTRPGRAVVRRQDYGFESHAGSTPMPLRRDALAPCRKSYWRWRASETVNGPKAVGTIGEAVIAKPSRNVIPGEIAFTADFRSADAAVMDALDKDRARRRRDAARRKSRPRSTCPAQPPTHFDPKPPTSRTQRKCSAIRIAASHPAPVTTPAISTPSWRRQWCSCPARTASAITSSEDATQADQAAGANVLMYTVLALAGVASRYLQTGETTCVEFSSTPMNRSP